MSILTADLSDYLFSSAAVPGNKWQVESFTGAEELSRPFLFRVVLVSTDGELDLDGPVGQPGQLLIKGLTGVRQVNGVVERFEQLSLGRKFSRYEATLVPTLYPLKYTRNSRIFQRLGTVEIVKKVLQEAGFSPGKVLSESLNGKYGPRDYCVQYQESDYDFIARLLEEEGIFYFFEHDDDKDVMVLGDGKQAIVAVPGAAQINFRDEAPEAVLEEEAVVAFRGESVLRPGGTIMRDFRFKQPGMDLEMKQQGEKYAKLQMYYFPGEYVEGDLGKRLAKVRLEEQQWDRQRFVGSGTSRALLPGFKFKLLGHARQKFNQEYLLVSVEHRASQPAVLGEEAGLGQVEATAYQSRICCIPVDVPFRPHRITPRPSIFGVQSAVVVGPPGEEIHCDEHGRVKVQFHWDREGKKNDDSSCWIRVSQPWGGAGQGGMFIPRVTQEVLVQFLEGDPDRPVIVGRVYNGENPVPHGLPAAKMISTIRSSSYPGGGGNNEIKFDDSAGKEEMFVNAQFDRNETTGHDQTLKVANNQTEDVGVDRTASVGSNETMSVGANQSLSVGGNRSHSVTGNEDIKVKGNQDTAVTGNQTLKVTGTQDIKVDGGKASLAVTSLYTVDATSKIALTAGSNLDVSAPWSDFSATSKFRVGSPIIELNGGPTFNGNADALEITGRSTLKALSPAVTIEGSDTVDVNGTTIKVTGNGEIEVSAPKIKITGGTEVTITAGGSTVKLSGSGVEISGSKISLN